MIFKLYDCQVGFKIAGQKYVFDHVSEVQVEDPEKNKLIRGANAGNKVGLAYKEGLKEAKKWTIPAMGMSAALFGVLRDCFANQTRIEVFCAASDGSNKTARNSILCNYPQQLKLDDTAESLQVSLEFESFDSIEEHRS